MIVGYLYAFGKEVLKVSPSFGVSMREERSNDKIQEEMENGEIPVESCDFKEKPNLMKFGMGAN